MKHFVNIVIENDGINENRDIAVDAVMQTANIGLNENALEYEMYESENNTQVLSIPISKNLNEAQQAFFAKRLANKLFDKGYTKFDIEFSVNESTLNEAAPTTFTPTHYGGLGGANNVMLHTDGNLYFNGPEGITRWNGNPSGEGIIGRWNPATIKGTIVNGQKVPYPSGTNFNNAPRAAAPTPTAAGNAPASRVSNTTPTGGLLRRGNRGEEVKQLQRDLGMTGDEIDGIFGPATERAVRTFQQNSGAKVDGLVGPETRAMIQKYQAPEDNSAPAQTPPTPTDDAEADQFAQDAVDAVDAVDAADQTDTTDNVETGNVMPRPNNNVSGSNWDKRFGATHNPDGTPKPDAATTAPAQPPAPTADDNDAPTTPGTDVQPSTNNPDGFLGGAETDNTPSVDPNADARQVVQDFDTWADKYSDKSRGRDMMPNEFVTQALDPALNELSVEKAQRLELDMEGAPATIQRIVQADVERTYGTLEEIIDAANDDTMPKDQQQALQILADMLKSLSINAPGNANENVEPMPKGVFMVEERSIWRSLYGKTHYTNGQARPRTFISESKSAIPEITFEDDDKFFENYGVMWFNEDEMIDEAEYQGRNVKLGKPMSGDVKKFKVYVKNPNGNVVKVNFGQKGARIKKDNPERRRSFRARHNCDNPGPRHKARYWSCRKW
jgi:peptidoglycan hydrolase-like protein with peptidoglycan-binding domain